MLSEMRALRLISRSASGPKGEGWQFVQLCMSTVQYWHILCTSVANCGSENYCISNPSLPNSPPTNCLFSGACSPFWKQWQIVPLIHSPPRLTRNWTDDNKTQGNMLLRNIMTSRSNKFSYWISVARQRCSRLCTAVIIITVYSSTAYQKSTLWEGHNCCLGNKEPGRFWLRWVASTTSHSKTYKITSTHIPIPAKEHSHRYKAHILISAKSTY